MNSSKKAVMPPRDKIFGFITGHALNLRKDRLGFMYHCLEYYGDFMKMFLGKQRTILINDPESVKYVLVDNYKNYPKNTPGYKRVADVLGGGVFTDVGPEWVKGRRVIQPFFNPRQYDNFFKIILDEAFTSIEKLKSSENDVNISRVSTQFTLNVIGRSLISDKMEDSFEIITKSLSELIHLTETRMLYLTNIKTPKKKKVEELFSFHLKAMDDEIKKVIEVQKKKTIDVKSNLIHALLNAEDKFSDEKLLAQIKTMLFAGHETSANVLIWAFYFLFRHPENQENIFKEFADKNWQLDSEEDLDMYPHLNRFIQEVLRMRPPAWSFGRIALEEDKIHGEEIKPGDLISLSPYLLQHNPRYWPEPMLFKPERFMEPARPFTMIPFGAGQRMCMGERLAMIELKVFLLLFIKNYSITISPVSQNIKMNAQVSLRPDKELYIQIKERK